MHDSDNRGRGDHPPDHGLDPRKDNVRIKSHRTILATFAFLLVALTAPVHVSASWTSNLAGRPLNGFSANTTGAPRQWNASTQSYTYNGGTGYGIAYAKIDGRIALLYPWHGRTHSSYDGKIVYGPNDTRIGTWAADVCYTPPQSATRCASNYDLAVIWIDSTSKPSALNQIYRGEVTGDNYWTVGIDPTTSHSCAGLNDGSEWGDGVRQNFQRTYSTTLPYESSTITSMVTYDIGIAQCLVMTTQAWHGYGTPSYRDSGTPFVLSSIPNTVSFFGTMRTGPASGGPNEKVIVSPLYGGLKVLDDYWETHGGNTGANLCHNATCT